MSASESVNIIFGAGTLGAFTTAMGIDSHALARDQLKVLEEEGITTIDTAEKYTGSEAELQHQNAAQRFTIHTKVAGGFAVRGKEAIIEAGQERLRALNTKQVEVLYIHVPDSNTPLTEQVEAYDVLYKQGVYKHLGLSNFSPQQVQEFYNVAKDNNCVLPTMYEGSYSAFTRLPEKELLLLLRRLGIAYNAYSPIAGGLLAKTREQFEAGVSRFNTQTYFGQMYAALFNKPSYLEALDRWGEIADEAGISRAELAFRWVAFHSSLEKECGDGIVLGAKDAAQLKESIRMVKAGPLPAGIPDKVDEVWNLIGDDAALDNWHGFLKDSFATAV